MRAPPNPPLSGKVRTASYGTPFRFAAHRKDLPSHAPLPSILLSKPIRFWAPKRRLRCEVSEEIRHQVRCGRRKYTDRSSRSRHDRHIVGNRPVVGVQRRRQRPHLPLRPHRDEYQEPRGATVALNTNAWTATGSRVSTTRQGATVYSDRPPASCFPTIPILY